MAQPERGSASHGTYWPTLPVDDLRIRSLKIFRLSSVQSVFPLNSTHDCMFHFVLLICLDRTYQPGEIRPWSLPNSYKLWQLQFFPLHFARLCELSFTMSTLNIIFAFKRLYDTTNYKSCTSYRMTIEHVVNWYICHFKIHNILLLSLTLLTTLACRDRYHNNGGNVLTFSDE